MSPYKHLQYLLVTAVFVSTCEKVATWKLLQMLLPDSVEEGFVKKLEEVIDQILSQMHAGVYDLIAQGTGLVLLGAIFSWMWNFLNRDVIQLRQLFEDRVNTSLTMVRRAADGRVQDVQLRTIAECTLKGLIPGEQAQVPASLGSFS